MLARLLPLTVLALSLSSLPARAGPDPSRIARYSMEEAQEEVQRLSVIPESSYVQLSGDLTIQNVFLADRSRVVYVTNVPIPTGQAQIVYLTTIQRQDFPGALTATPPHLQITAQDASGALRVFTVALVLGGGHPTRAIIGDPATRAATADAQYIQTRFGQASIYDLEAGLKVAIARESLSPTSPTALRIQEFITLWRNGHTVADAQGATGLNWAVLERLATDGQKARARKRRDRFEEAQDTTAAGEPDPVADVAVPSSPPIDKL